ncbi:transposase [Hoeflea sp.]|uniref:transposase n=1 Tax=Hoeflea sp. TaxID=1940281 RepID=UPI003B01B553
MSHLFWLDQEHLNRIKHMFPKPRGVARSNDLTVLSSIIHLIRNGLRWRDVPTEYGPHKMLYNRFVRWSRLGDARAKHMNKNLGQHIARH